MTSGHLRPWIWLAIAVVLGVGLGWLPLVGVLGYELALVAAVFAAVCGLDLGAASARWIQTARTPVLERSAYPGRSMLRSTARASCLAVAISLGPGLAAAIHGIWASTWDWQFGMISYALMPVLSAALGGALGHAIGVAVGVRSRTSWLPHRSTILGVVLPIVLLALAGFWRFYSEPPIFIYNAIIGYFPGNMYDENIRLGMPLVWSRVEQAAWVIAIVAAVAARLDVPSYRVVLRGPRPGARRIVPLAIAIVFAVGATALHVKGGDLGYAIDASDIQAELAGRIETPHFVIHYAKTPEIEADIKLIAEDHELRYAEVVAQLGMAPAGKLRSYYFADGEQKARWFGARNVEMAKPWRHEIYIDHRAFPHTSLRHEIAHAVASAFGDPILGVATRNLVLANPGLIEGLAVAIDWPGGEYGPLTPHQAVRALQVMGLEPSISELLSIQFFFTSSARGYTTAGSFLRFLLDRYGAAKLRTLYGNGGDFAGAYGIPEQELEAEWRAMIAKIELPPEVIEGTRERFRGGSVFSRPCPHAIAARRDRAAALLGRGDRAGAVALLRHVCAEAPEEPRHRLELGDVLSVGDSTEHTEAIDLWTTIANDDHVTSTLRAEALEKLARAASDPERIALIDRARTLPVDLNERRQLDAESFALHYAGPAGDALRDYFFAKPAPGKTGITYATQAVHDDAELGFGHYLLGLQASNARDWQTAASELQLGLDHGLPGTNFVRFASRRLAVAAYRAGDVVRVRRAITAMQGPDMAETDHLLADDWAHRLQFDATGHL